jgi:hypothetical protein
MKKILLSIVFFNIIATSVVAVPKNNTEILVSRVCPLFKQGKTAMEVVQSIYQAKRAGNLYEDNKQKKFDMDYSILIVLAAVDNHCPQYKNLVKGL